MNVQFTCIHYCKHDRCLMCYLMLLLCEGLSAIKDAVSNLDKSVLCFQVSYTFIFHSFIIGKHKWSLYARPVFFCYILIYRLYYYYHYYYYLGYWRQRADERHGNPLQINQEPLVVKDKVGIWHVDDNRIQSSEKCHSCVCCIA